MTNIGVIGASGRMGSEACRALEDVPEMTVAARIGRGDPLEILAERGCEVAVDFTTPDAVKGNVHWCVEHGIHVVVGTTGLSDDDLDDIRKWTDASRANVLVAPNFAIGAVLMMIFAARAAPYFEVGEVVERHHLHKVDAPSGTALRTARLMNEARGRTWAAVSGGAARGVDEGGVRIHSLRTPGSVAHQEVILGAAGQTLSIRHDSLDRASFMPGVVLAVTRISDLRGLTVGLEHLLEP